MLFVRLARYAHARVTTTASASQGLLFVEPKPAPPVTRLSLCVLASSSGGNCSALIHGEGRTRRVTLIDCGLSPRKTRLFLKTLGLDIDHIDNIILTHLDSDHCHTSWITAMPRHARFRIHKNHRNRAKREGFLHRRTEIFEESPFELPDSSRVTPVMLSHDELGVAAFRIDCNASSGGDASACGSLGYATDLGRVTDDLVRTLTGVDVLAIESNYCPDMQLASDRPDFLKQRIMNGSGHLSNEECRDAVRAIAPRRDVVLLHLSRQCNSHERAASFHANASYRLTVAAHDRPTTLISVA